MLRQTAKMVSARKSLDNSEIDSISIKTIWALVIRTVKYKNQGIIYLKEILIFE